MSVDPHVPPPPQVMPHYVGQQQQQQQTTIVVTQPTVEGKKLLIGNIHGTRQWTSDLFDCFSDCGTCMYGWCCYCCMISSISSRLGESCCTVCCVPAADIGLRTRIRTLGDIQGSMCNDCMTIACCAPCAACQEYRELQRMGL